MRVSMVSRRRARHELATVSVMGPVVGEDVAVASLNSALQQSAGGGGHACIMGQTNAATKLEANPSVYTNPEQPFVQVCLS